MSDNLSPNERNIALSLGSIFSFRMLGLFMVLPVFTFYADKLPGSTPLLIGVALGIYGLVQACLQIPFGMLSDHFGRKPMICFGLSLFAVGSICAALAHGMWGLILGRALQGAGAVGSTIIALMADLTEESHRGRAMALIGLCIGLSFALAIVFGPMLAAWGGLSAIFWLTAGLAIVGIVMLYTIIPNPRRSAFHNEADVETGKLLAMLTSAELLRLDIGILISHAMLTATFFVMPIVLHHLAGVHITQQWLFYLPILFISFVAMVPFVIIAEKKRQMKPLFLAAIALAMIAQWLLAFEHHRLVYLASGLFLYFVSFNFLEACLPSLIAKVAPAGSKGTAMGIYSTSQFFGIFLGGVCAGLLLKHVGVSGIFASCGFLAAVWLLVAFAMSNPRYLSTMTIKVALTETQSAESLSKRLLAVAGVEEAVVVAEQGVAYLKLDKANLDSTSLELLKL